MELPRDALKSVDSKITSLEKRIHVVAEQIARHAGNRAPAAARVNGRGKLKISAGDSLFEVLLERIVQGYHGFADEDFPVEQLTSLAHDTEDLVCFVNRDAAITSWNPLFHQSIGSPSFDITGRLLSDLIEEPYRSNFGTHLERVARRQLQGVPASPDDILLFRLLRPDGTRSSVEAIAAPIEEGAETFAVVMRDLSMHRDLLEELRESRDNYDALSETITEAILRINEDLEIVFANSAVKTTFGFDPAELRGCHFSILFPESVFQRSQQDFRKYFVVDDRDRRKLGMQNTIEILGRHKNRGVAPMEMSFGNSKEYRGRTLTCIIRDITQRKNAERKLRHLAYHDQLTALGNRDLFDSDMRRLFDTPELFSAGCAALMFLDLDGFKQVNDTIGHSAGDQLLIQTARRLRKTLRESDAVYRFGGDEFVVLLSFIHDRRGAAVVANNILGEIRRPYSLTLAGGSPTTVSVGVSIGIAIIPEDGNSIEAATKAADLAMYSAKEAGKNRFAYYDQSLDTRAQDRWRLEQGMRTSLERQEFRMTYQPLVDTQRTIVGVEGLLRWNHPEHGDVSPAKFVPIAEETGMIVPLGTWAIETAFRDACSWPDYNQKPLLISVNLSAKQFERSDFVESIGSVINRSRIDPKRIVLEVTETCVMNAPERSIATLQALKSRHPGLSIAIDDFGTGYSSLSYLTRLPADIIKIDISFVSNLFVLNNEQIVRAIVNLAHSLGLRIVAEGVETAEQFAYFSDKGCFGFQGYHFHRPLPAAQLPSLLTSSAVS